MAQACKLRRNYITKPERALNIYMPVKAKDKLSLDLEMLRAAKF